MADRESPYDPHIPSGAAQGDLDEPSGSNNKYTGLKDQVDQVSGQLRNNIKLVTERGDNLGNLQQRTDHLNHAAQDFHNGAHRARKRMWWQNMKMRIWIIVGIIILLIIIIVPSVVASRR